MPPDRLQCSQFTSNPMAHVISTTDADRAWLLCLDLSEEYGYAQVRDAATGIIIGDYTDGR